jgi:aspartate aminotransferase
MLRSMPTTEPILRLSQRVRNLRPSATFAVSALVSRLRAEGRDVIGFGTGEPDFDTPDDIKQAAIDALRAGATRYMPVAGEPNARRTIAEKLQRENGIECRPDDVVITVGAKHAMYLAFQCLLDPADQREVIVPTPAWVSYRPMVELAGGVVTEVPGAFDNDYKITPAQLESAITPRTAAVLINSPSNPCGTMYDPDELRALAGVLGRHAHVSIVTDEIYEKLIYGEAQHLSLGSMADIADRVVTVNGLSKAYAMTGWRVGYACAPGGGDGAGAPSLASAMAKLQGQMTSNITSFCYAAIVEALTHGADSVERMRRTFAERSRLMYDRIRAMPGLRCPRPTGAFYVFPDVSAHFGKRSAQGRAIDSSAAFAEALVEEANVGVVPGAAFGAAGEGHVRLSFACSTEQIEEGCRRLDAWLRALG